MANGRSSSQELALRILREAEPLTIANRDQKESIEFNNIYVEKLASFFSDATARSVLAAFKRNTAVIQAEMGTDRVNVTQVKRQEYLRALTERFTLSAVNTTAAAILQEEAFTLSWALARLLYLSPQQVLALPDYGIQSRVLPSMALANPILAVSTQGNNFDALLQAVLFPLQSECRRLESLITNPDPLNDPASLEEKASRERRKQALEQASTEVATALENYARSPTEHGACRGTILQTLDNLQKNEDIVKYKGYELWLRRVANAVLLIFTGIIPGMVKFALTGTLFLSNQGQTKNVVDATSGKMLSLTLR